MGFWYIVIGFVLGLVTGGVMTLMAKAHVGDSV
ncbi:hypothetical protein DLP05_114 [Stenotrophomonas phage vB_SmaS_DLP_5]|uniref:Uncharacterized protein n=1 Tax=Stenotrophomonas phage vB_SmaS_DLP_5 TaxID=2044561 RepID=A0A2D2W2R3_9CAUD|nr:hypothetical protein FDJ07_gp107 [Stenotrophomonas phage vB_SmaS_DLP_5]ATS92418.1 hypothetical protein DLP05_114 [Stenotrophomonas phage vB_SmaS_DLP_5]